MQAVTGIFTSFDDARRSAEELGAQGFSHDQINLLAPGSPAAEIENIPATEGEQPGMGKAVGGVVGAAVGTAAGAPLGMTLAAAMVPGVGPAVAIGLAASALLGIGGAIGGAAAGGSLENALTAGLPKDEVFVYEDALRQGRTAMIALAGDGDQAEAARQILRRNGAESIDAAREQWWVGLRDAEQEQYTSSRLRARTELLPQSGGRSGSTAQKNLTVATALLDKVGGILSAMRPTSSPPKCMSGGVVTLRRWRAQSSQS